MRYLIVIFFVGCFFVNGSSQDYITAAGGRIGDGLSVTLKHFTSEKTALELIMGFQKGTSIVCVYTLHNKLSNNQDRLKYYVGGGGFVLLSDGSNSTTYFGLAGALGVEYIIPTGKIAFSMDWNPAINFTGDFGAFQSRFVGVGAKYIIGAKTQAVGEDKFDF